MPAREADIGTFIRTPYGIGMIQEINPLTDRYLVMYTNAMRWIDAETVLPGERIDADLRDPEIIEKYLNGETITQELQEPDAAESMPCADICKCDWCYVMSSNGFHMANRGQCRCDDQLCVCVVNSEVRGRA